MTQLYFFFFFLKGSKKVEVNMQGTALLFP